MLLSRLALRVAQSWAAALSHQPQLATVRSGHHAIALHMLYCPDSQRCGLNLFIGTERPAFLLFALLQSLAHSFLPSLMEIEFDPTRRLRTIYLRSLQQKPFAACAHSVRLEIHSSFLLRRGHMADAYICPRTRSNNVDLTDQTCTRSERIQPPNHP